MTDNIVNMPPPRDLVPTMIGPERQGNDLIIDGRVIPNIAITDYGEEVLLVLDGRMAFLFPREIAYLAASFAANAMAVGGGYASAISDTKDRPFACTCSQIDGGQGL